MKKIAIFLSLIFFSFVIAQAGGELRILNGDEIGQGEIAPIGAFIRYDDGAIECTIVVLTPFIAITAGHCPWGRTERLGVAVGSMEYEFRTVPEALRIAIKSMRIHEGFDITSLDDDLALIFTEQPMIVPQYAQLVTQELAAIGMELNIVGFGNTAPLGQPVNYPDRAHVARAHLLSDRACAFFGLTNLKKTLCLDESSTGASQGDSGGPLFARTPMLPYALIGTTSRGHDGKWGIYMEISQYLDWIQRVVQEEGFAPIPVHDLGAISGSGNINLDPQTATPDPIQIPVQNPSPINPTGQVAIGAQQERWFKFLQQYWALGLGGLIGLCIYGYFRIFRNKSHNEAYLETLKWKAELDKIMAKRNLSEVFVLSEEETERRTRSGGAAGQSGKESKQKAISNLANHPLTKDDSLEMHEALISSAHEVMKLRESEARAISPTDDDLGYKDNIEVTRKAY